MMPVVLIHSKLQDGMVEMEIGEEEMVLDLIVMILKYTDQYLVI
jgi:hypothetical protein